MSIEMCKCHIYGDHLRHLEKPASGKYLLCMNRLVSPSVNKTTTESWDGSQPCGSSSHARNTQKFLSSRSSPSLNQFSSPLSSKLALDIILFLF